MSGQPGGPQDWVVSGGLQKLMDEFAAQHNGLAPVTVVVDPNGAEDGNTMCMDSDIAKADTYLTVDVVNWITANVGIDSNHAHWAFGGWSFGGPARSRWPPATRTCSPPSSISPASASPRSAPTAPRRSSSRSTATRPRSTR
ncbi:hypothetical protein ACFQV8_36515 [Pseudonocardia benzenivorans]